MDNKLVRVNQIKELLESDRFRLNITKHDLDYRKEDILNDITYDLLNGTGLEGNFVDFDCYRIYNEGYQKEENWDDLYLIRFKFCNDDKEIWVEVL